MTGMLGQKFKLLLWKNFKIISRHPFILALCVAEALIPLVLIYIATVAVEVIPHPQKSHKIEKITHLRPMENSGVVMGLSYSPENEFLGNIVKYAAAKLNLPVLALPTEYVLERHLLKNITIAGIVFEDNWRNLDTYPSNLSYKLRMASKILKGVYGHDELVWHTSERYPSFQLEAYNPYGDDNSGKPPYFSKNFVQIQHALFLAFMQFSQKSEDVGKSVQIPEIFMGSFPVPATKEDVTWEFWLCKYVVVLILPCPSAYLSQFIAVERKKQFKMVTATMGVPNWLHWVSWYISGIIFFLCFMIALFIFYEMNWEGDSIVTDTNTLLLITYLFVFVLAYVSFSFMFGIFFSDSSEVYILAFLLHVILQPAFFVALSAKYESMEAGQLFLMSLYMNFAAVFAMTELAYFEDRDLTLDFQTMYSVSKHPTFSFGYALNMLLVDSIIYLLITLYVEQLICPYPRSWHYPLLGVVRMCKRKKDVEEDEDIEPSESDLHKTVEEHIGINIMDLDVEINGNRVIREVSMKAYEGELTVIFGHGGGGKSTLAAVMVGALMPTKGKVIIDNCNMRNRENLARRRVGYFPPVDMLLNELTAKEHIWLCSGLKGSKEVQTEQDLIKYTSALGLERKLQTKCQRLLLTEKNMVILCTTLCGGSRVVICDEPALGLDPTSKELIWNLLRMERKEKTILVLSKSVTKEINMFADRAGILLEGELRGYGELSFFKNSVGGGYEILCLKEEHCVTDQVTNFLKKFIPDIMVEEEREHEIDYLLSGMTMLELSKLITELQQQKETLGIQKFSLRLRLPEEITLSSGNAAHVKSKPITFPDLHLIHDFHLTRRRWRAMLFKKLVYTISRFWMPALWLFVMCILYAYTTYQLWEIVYEEPPVVSFDSFETSKAILQEESNLTIDQLLTSTTFQVIEKRISREYILQTGATVHLDINKNFDKFILEKLEKNTIDLFRNYLVAATIRKENITAWFNDAIFHTPPLSLNLVHNAIAKAFCGSSYFISLQNAPLIPHYIDQIKNASGGNNIGIFSALTLAIITPLCIVQILAERETGYKSFQLSTGLPPAIYWASSMLWDYIMTMVIALTVMVSVCSLTVESPFFLNMIGVMCFVYLVYGFAAITSSYLFACFFTEQNSYIYLAGFNIITGIGLITIFQLLLGSTWHVAEYALLIFPHYACTKALTAVFAIMQRRTLCNSFCEELGICNDLCSKIPYCCEEHFSYFSLNYGVSRSVLYMTGVGILCLFLFILYEMRGLRCTLNRMKRRGDNIQTPSAMDKNAAIEALRVSTMTEDQKRRHPVLLEYVSYFYGDFRALNQVSFAVSKREIFGIVGPAGAGKTTIIKLLTLALKPSLGEILLYGGEVEKFFIDDISRISYCPEGGGLVGYLTGRDALHICCLLRGITDRDIKFTYGRVVKYLGIKNLLDTEIRYYNESDKKKLSVAMSVLGNLDIILLDQPTYGIEPAAIRKICDLIEIWQAYGKTVIFTTQSVIEGFLLCNRVALLINGEVFSTGSPDVLDSSLERGISLIIKFQEFTDTPDQSDKLLKQNIIKTKRFIARTYPDIILRTEYHGILQYIMNGAELSDWVPLIQMMEDIKGTYGIKNYEITEIDIATAFETLTYQQHMVHRRKGRMQAV